MPSFFWRIGLSIPAARQCSFVFAVKLVACCDDVFTASQSSAQARRWSCGDLVIDWRPLVVRALMDMDYCSVSSAYVSVDLSIWCRALFCEVLQGTQPESASGGGTC